MGNSTPLVIGLLTAMNVAARALPFVLPRRLAESGMARAVGRRLPPIIMILLLIHCLHIEVSLGAHFPAVAVTAAVHLWKRHMLLSIACGTVLYSGLVSGWWGLIG